MELSQVDIDLGGIKSLKVSNRAIEKMFSYARAVESEIGGLLLIDKSGEAPLVKDVLLFKQTASGSGMELDDKELARQMQKIADSNPSKLEQLGGWFHSHADFGVFWSAIDDDCFETFSQICPVTYGIVVNKAGEMLARADIKLDIGTIKFKDLKIVPNLEHSKRKYLKAARRSIIEKKSESSYPIATTSQFEDDKDLNEWWKDNEVKKEEENFNKTFWGGWRGYD